MLRVQELCKEKGITMQELAKKMGVTYQALYSSISGNPTIGKLGEIANALEVDVVDLFATSKRTNASFVCPHCGKSLTIKIE